MILSPNEIAWVVLHYWPEIEDARVAVAICLAESGGETDALGRSSSGNRDHGLWQISNYWHGIELQKNPCWRYPMVNAKLARAVYDEFKAAGKNPWSAWNAYNKNLHEVFLLDADIALKAPFFPPY